MVRYRHILALPRRRSGARGNVKLSQLDRGILTGFHFDHGDNVSGLVVNLTPMVLDQCDIGFSGNPSNFACGAPASGNAGSITAAGVYTGGGGSGYSVGDANTIHAANSGFGAYYGSGTATYEVTSVSSGAVTGFTVTNGGYGYTYTNSGYFGSGGTPTTATSGSGSGLFVNITGVGGATSGGGYDGGSVFPCAITMICADEAASNNSLPARSQIEVVVATGCTATTGTCASEDRPLQPHPEPRHRAPQLGFLTGSESVVGKLDRYEPRAREPGA
jgi:hypothetical protein